MPTSADMRPPTVTRRVARHLKVLSSDYEQVTGAPFENFFCPVLYRDDAVELCDAHIINQAFGASSLTTVQRKDVDGFFGTHFESDFVALADRKYSAAEVMADATLMKRLRPSIVIDGEPISYYSPTGPVPAHHSRIILDGPGGETPLVLKVPPADVAALVSAPWQIKIEKDVRIPAMVSLLKAAHLTLFRMLGYQYVLSAGGHLVGWEALGKFFLANVGKPRAQVGRMRGPTFVSSPIW